MNFGVSIRACTTNPPRSTDYILGALDHWIDDAGAIPDIVPMWWRLESQPRSFGEQLLLHDALRSRSIVPAYYVTSSSERMLSLATTFAKELPLHGCIVRLNQEPNGNWKAPWAQLSPESYRAQFRLVAEAIHDKSPGALMYWCLINRRDNRDWDDYYPDGADLVGFDSYERNDRWRSPADRWRKPIAKLGRIAPGKPIVIGETSIRRGIPGRTKWVRSLGDVEGVRTIIAYDIDMNPTLWPGHLYGFREKQRRALGRLMK